MLKMFTKFHFLICLILIIQSDSIAQKENWKVLFPGYDANKYNASIDAGKSLNMVLNGSVAGLPSKFITLDSKGYVTFSENTNEIALLHFKDSLMNRYLISYSAPNLRIKKYDSQGNQLYDNSNLLSNAVTVGSILPDWQFIESANYLFTSNGTMVISGLFKTDSSSTLNGLTLDLFYVEPGTGSILNQYVHASIENYVSMTNLQEDDSLNINVIHYNDVFPMVCLKKVNGGNLVMSRNFGDDLGYSETEAVKFTNNFIYLIVRDDNYQAHLLKLNKNTFDTLYYVNLNLSGFSILDNWEADDSTFYLSYDNGGSGAFRTYGDTGTITCQDNSGNQLNFGYKLVLAGNKCYSAKNTFSQRDTACIFEVCSDPFDFYTQELIYERIGFRPYPDDNYSCGNISYIVSKTLSDVLGVIGLIDEKPKNFSGLLYHDVNLNCVADSAEPGIVNQMVKIDPAGSFLFTDQAGFFENYLDSGSYTLSAIPFNNTLALCPISIPLGIVDTTQFYSGNDLGIQDQSGNLQDLSISVNQTPAVPGIKSYVYVTIKNFLPLPASGVISLTLDPVLFSLNFSSLPVDSSSGNIFYWHVNNLDFLSQHNFLIELDVNTQSTPGVLFSTIATITNISGENNLINNSDQFQGEVLSSFDPNDKHVVPKGIGTSGMISTLDTIINYKIRFQNTGTYTAFKVYVIDTIDSSLDISTFRLQSTSHDCQLSFLDTNVIQFTFENISLPHSAANVVLSNGFINYSLNLKDGLPLLTSIKNKAYIYFDYNEPVVTNEVINTLGALNVGENMVGMDIILYPNPATELLNVIFEDSEAPVKLAVLDMSGRELSISESTKASTRCIIQLKNIPSGFYFIKAETRSKVIVKPFVKL